MDFLRKIAEFIERHQLLRPDGLYLVGLSGGADSVALLLALRSLGYQVEAVHCNFRLRGAEADRDEQFCRELCAREDVPFHVVHFDTRAYAALHHVSVEMAARDLRYGYFRQLCHDIGAAAVCVAHHADDQVETILMHLIRGTGLHGLTGMSPRNGQVLRPLLDVTRHDIEQWLAQCRQPFVTDSTNLVDDVVRNKVRHHVVPLLTDINPSATDNILKMSQHLVEAEKVITAAVRPMQPLVVDELLRQPSPLYTLYVSLKDYGFNASQIEQVAQSLTGPSGREWRSATHQLVIHRGRILVEPLQAPLPALVLPEPGVYVYTDAIRFRVQMFDKTADFSIDKSREVALLDASKVAFPLQVRPVQAGDRFHPLGMRGSKLLSDYMTDRKMSLFSKRRQLVVTDARGTIVWVVNERPSELAKVTSSTKQLLKLTFLMHNS